VDKVQEWQLLTPLPEGEREGPAKREGEGGSVKGAVALTLPPLRVGCPSPLQGEGF
jgi:hypothetical protein